MVITGLGTLILSLFCPFIDLPNRFILDDVTSLPSLSSELPLIAGVSVGSLVGGLLVVYACQTAPPSLVAVVRSTEIIPALFSDYVIFQTITDPSMFHLGGSFISLVSVALMSTRNASRKITQIFFNKIMI